MSLSGALTTFTQSLNLTEGQRQEATRQHTALRTALQQRMSLRDNFISGSYGRGTAIRPLDDIDVFVVLDADRYAELRQASPRRTLEELSRVLREALPGKATRLQGRSVNLSFSGTGIAYDLVPAFADGPDRYLIPQRDGGGWTRTNPRVHKERSQQAHQRSGGTLLPLVKVVKHWNRRNDKPLTSFHLEVMAWGALRQPPESLPEGLARVLEHAAEAVLQPCPDPAGLGPDLDAGLDRGRARKALRVAARVARDAVTLAQQGRHDAGKAQLQGLLGSDFPLRP